MIKKVLAIFFLTLVVFSSTFVFALNIIDWLSQVGVLQEKIYIAGTGSMYPTFPKGEGTSDIVRAQKTVAWPKMRRYPGGIHILSKYLFGYTIGRGDIVSFSNAKTKDITTKHYGQDSGFVKRVIAISGDSLEIKDGFVYINGKIQNEPYTAKTRSTYGGTFLSDCRVLKVSPSYIFVMGDNRKSSLDSRSELGLVSLTDIDHVIPLKEQDEFKTRWRDTNGDLAAAGQPSLNLDEYMRLYNQKRVNSGLSPISYNKLLEQSAMKRAKTILSYNDLSFEATKSGYTMQKALEEVGYNNPLWGEAPVLGYYDGEELIDNYFQFPETKKFLLDKDFQETGLAVLVGQINNCPTQVIVQHFAGYVPPNYKEKDIDQWRKIKNELERILPGWEKARDYKEFYDKNKDALERIVTIIKRRIEISTTILNRMEANLWLTPDEKKTVKEDSALGLEQENLAEKLNKNN